MPDEMAAIVLQMLGSQMETKIVDALKQWIDTHGPITRQNPSSANRRVRLVGSDE